MTMPTRAGQTGIQSSLTGQTSSQTSFRRVCTVLKTGREQVFLLCQ